MRLMLDVCEFDVSVDPSACIHAKRGFAMTQVNIVLAARQTVLKSAARAAPLITLFGQQLRDEAGYKYKKVCSNVTLTRQPH